LLAQAPRNGISLYLADYADLLYLLVAEDRAAYDRLEAEEDERLKRVRRMDDASPWNRFIQAEIKLHWAFVKIKFGHETSGAFNVIQAYRLASDNVRRFPNFLPNQKILGLLHVLIGSTPEQYRWVTNLLGLRGDVPGGRRELANVAAHDPIFGDEARLMDFLIRVYITKTDARQLGEFEEFVRQRPDNLLLRFFGVAALIKEGHSETALGLLASRPTGPEYLPLPFFDYYRGDILLQKKQYVAAFAAYQAFLNAHRGRNFVKDATYKQALCAWLQNDDGRARTLLNRMREVGETTVEPDKVAQRFAEQFDAITPDRAPAQKALMRARLAFDGGYYAEALDDLKSFSESNVPQPRDRAELAYRRARILHRSADSSRAAAFYERALALSDGQPWYFGAMSALQLGYLAQAKGQNQKARAYFEKALAFRKHEYKNSVDNKAKAALNELGY
jgi:tetratricopeptide (TPR) repeat protein